MASLRHERRQERHEDHRQQRSCIIIDTEFVKPGKGQAFTRIKYRNIKTGRTVEMTMKATDSSKPPTSSTPTCSSSTPTASSGTSCSRTPSSRSQADKAGVGDAAKWLKGEEECVVTLWNGAPIAVQPPNFVELKIVETDPGVRGDTSGGGGKPAKLETGAVVRVPLFVGQDEMIKVDTRTGEYVSRVK